MIRAFGQTQRNVTIMQIEIQKCSTQGMCHWQTLESWAEHLRFDKRIILVNEDG